MSDLFYGSPPPRSPTPAKPLEEASGAYVESDLSSAKTPGYRPTSPQQADVDFKDDNNDIDHNVTTQQSGSPGDHLRSAKTPGNFHDTDEVLNAKTPGHFGGTTVYDQDEDEEMTGAKTPGVAGGILTDGVKGFEDINYRLNATTPYHFGGSPGPDFPDVENAEATRQAIYEQIAQAQDEAERLQVDARNMGSARTPSFAESAAMIRTPTTNPSVYDDEINRSGFRTVNPYTTSNASRNPNSASSTPYINPHDPRRGRARLPASRGTGRQAGARKAALAGRTPLSIANDSNVHFDDDDASVADSDVNGLDTSSIMAEMASIDAAVPNLHSDPNAGRMSNLIDPFKVPERPASTYTTPHRAPNNFAPSPMPGRKTPNSARGSLRRPSNNRNDGVAAAKPGTTPLHFADEFTDNGNKRKRPARGSSSDNEDSSTTPGPKKRTSKVPKVAVPKAPKTPRTPKPPKERLRAPPKSGKAVDNKPIPRSLAECDEADRQLILMRDAGEPWAPIKAKYSELSGDTYGHSTLPNRYERLKANFITIREEDNILILEAKKEIEEEFDAGKWNSIAEKVIEKEGGSYDGTTLQRQFKKLMQSQGFNVRDGMARQDVDFAGGDSDDDDEEEDYE